MRLIKLTKGYFAQVDDEDFERVSQFKWFADVSGRLQRKFTPKKL